MAYATYTTEAIVCGHKDSYTSDRSFLLFTLDAGMVWASARSVREERSKQRYALQDFSWVRVSLVKGKAGWKIGSVSALRNFYAEAKERELRGQVTRILRLVRQFVHGESPHPHVFTDTREVLSALVEESVTSAELLEVYTLRLLHQLGYIAPHNTYDTLLTDAHWTMNPTPIPSAAKKAIEHAFSVSHL
ncbi:MAG: DNA repair protein RecO C-terminal domain-containing protein [Candidatus Paceibacterota bacterium]